jgi:alpha-D-ribose 1-methylphosphonate 5-triphosphate diphosphatase
MNMMGKDFIIENASLVCPEKIIEDGTLIIENGVIAELRSGYLPGDQKRIDAKGKLIIPGFVDIHSDAIEKEIEPRPRSYFPFDIAITELDKKMAASGITTIYHSLSFAENEIGLRKNETAAAIVKKIKTMAPYLSVNTKVHVRYEITDTTAVTCLEELVHDGSVHLLSFMDHTPGQGQFKEVMEFKNYFGTVYQKQNTELDCMIERKLSVLQDTKEEILGYLIGLCKRHKIPLASHDDDTAEKIDWMRSMGITISEFPVNIEAAHYASNKGLYVCVGAPNILRGSSVIKNLSARQAVGDSCVDIICSDYVPMAMLHAVFILHRTLALPLHEVVKMASLYPAEAVGISGSTGSLEAGKVADLIIVDHTDAIPRIKKAFVSGREVFSTY